MGRIPLTRLTGAILVLLLSLSAAPAEENAFRLAVPQTLVDTGLLKHLLPRFSLKHGIRITLVGSGEPADAALDETASDAARAVFSGGGTTYYLGTIPGAESPATAKFSDWISSDIGRAAIESFAGPPAFTAGAAARITQAAAAPTGDLARGEELSLLHCGRCHVVNERNRMSGLGSTPSFAVMRTFPDWKHRFDAFFALKPHPAFTLIDGLTDPLPPDRPPNIVPIEMTLGELEDIVAYAASVAPADLGAPIKHQ